MDADDGPSGSQFIALRTRVPVEVVRPRARAPRQYFSPGPVRNWAVGGRDLLSELNTWVRSLPDRPSEQHENEPESELARRAREPMRAVMPPPLASTIDGTPESFYAAASDDLPRDHVTARALSAPSAPPTA